MLRSLFGVFAALAMVVSAQAGPLSSHLTFDHVPDLLDDDSVGFIADLDASGSLSVGDVVAGVLRIGTTTANGVLAPDDQLVGYYSFQIATSTGVAGANPQVDLTAVGTDPLLGTGLSIDEMLAFHGIAAPAVGAAGMAAVLSSQPNTTNITDESVAGAIGLGGALGAYSLDAILGLGTADDYTELRSFLDTDDSGEIDFAELPALGTGGFIGSESAGWSVLHHTLGASTSFIPVASLHEDGVTTTFHDVSLDGTIFASRPTTAADWTIVDSTSLTVNAVPEPGSLAVWGLLIGVGAVGYRRRNKKNA